MRNIGVVILAGGQSKRMGKEKSLVECNGESLIERAVKRVGENRQIVVNANGDGRRFNMVKCPVVADSIGEFAGPLAGILAGLEWGAKHPDLTHMVSVAVDTPFFPKNLITEFARTLSATSLDEGGVDVALAKSNEQRHPVFGIWAIELVSKLQEFLTHEKSRKVMDFVQKQKWTEVVFEQKNEIDPFFNINTIEDLEQAVELEQADIYARQE